MGFRLANGLSQIICILMIKQVFIKNYDTSGIFKGVFFDFAFSNFTESLNSGLGDVSVVVPRNFDNYNFDGAIEEGFETRIFIADQEDLSGIQIGSFKLDEIDTQVSDTETVSLSCSGYIHELALDLVEKQTPAANTVIYTTPNQDLSQTIKDVIDLYQTNNTNPKVNYGSGTTTISNTGKTEAVEIVMNSPADIIEHCAKQADPDWFFRVGIDNLVYFQQISSTPDHLFTLGKDIISLNPKRSLRDVRNNFIITNGLASGDADALLKNYTDATSTTTYGRRFEKKRDGRFKATGNTADEWGARNVGLFKDPINKVRARIVDSNIGGGYDIESVNVGDTFKFRNLVDNPAITGNMIITSKTYGIDFIDITADDTQTYVSRQLEERRKGNNILAFTDDQKSAYTV